MAESERRNYDPHIIAIKEGIEEIRLGQRDLWSKMEKLDEKIEAVKGLIFQKNGLAMEVDRNSRFRRSTSKFLWIVIGILAMLVIGDVYIKIIKTGL